MITTDNLRKFRRVLQGRGVNIRETIVEGTAATTAILIPNLKAEDEIVSILDLDTPADMGANLVGPAAAVLEIQAGGDTGLDFSARKPGAAGNGITIEYVDPGANSAELSVTVAGSAIVVNLATDTGGSITSTAGEIRAAVLDNQEAAKLVDVALHSGDDGTGVVTDEAEAPLADGADSSVQGPQASYREIGSSNARVMYTAETPGTGGDGIGIVYAVQVPADAPLTVVVSGKTITVKLANTSTASTPDTTNTTGPNTASRVAAAVNAGSAGLVSAEIANGSGVTYVGTQTILQLQNGRDEGEFQLDTTSAGNTLKVMWLTQKGM